MKSIKLVVGILLIVAFLAIPIPAVQAGSPPGSWVSGITCQNLTGTAGDIVIAFYQQGSSTEAYSYPDTIAANGTKNYYTPSNPPGIPSPFVGSAVVSSSVSLACNVNTQTTGTGTAASPFRIGTSAGFSSTDVAGTFYAPQVVKAFSGWDSYIAVQNAGSTDANVNVTFKDRAGNSIPAANQSFVLHPNTDNILYQNDNAGLPSGFIGAATITGGASDKLAVIVNFYNTGSSASTSQFHSYNGFSQGASKLYIPRVIRKYYNYNSGITVQNVGATDSTYTIDFYFGADHYVYNSGTIKSGAAEVLYAPNIAELNPLDAKLEKDRYGFAVVTSSGSFVAIDNEDNRGGTGVPVERAGQGATYNAVLDGTQTTTVFFPQVPRNKSGFSGGFIVSNTTNTPGTCDITFSGVPAANMSAQPLAANGSISIYLPNVPNLPDGFNQGVSATCTVAVVGIANFSINVGTGKVGDSFTQYNGINQ